MSKDPNPLLSVIITTYNHEDFIGKCLDSVSQQQMTFPFEIIIGEDDSTDGTRQICLEYARKYPDQVRLLLHRREDNIFIDGKPTGRYNLIKCLEAARGRYFASIDGDDFLIAPDKFQRQVELLEAHPEYAICFHPPEFVDDAGNRIQTHLERDRQVPVVADLNDLAARRLPIYKGTCVFRNSLDPLPDWYYHCPMGDIPLYYLYGQYGKIRYLKEKMSAYRVHQGGLYMGKSKAKRRAMSLRTRKAIFDHTEAFRGDFRAALLESLKEGAYVTTKNFYAEGDLEQAGRYHQLFLELAKADLKYLPYRLKLFFHYLTASLK